jgi:hypothetical protein
MFEQGGLGQLIIGSTLRHVLTAVAGALVSAGALSNGQESQFVAIGSGLVLWALAYGWSWYQKQGHVALQVKFNALAAQRNQKG